MCVCGYFTKFGVESKVDFVTSEECVPTNLSRFEHLTRINGRK